MKAQVSEVLKLGTSQATKAATSVKNHAALTATKVKHFSLGDWGSIASILGLGYIGWELVKRKK